MSSLCIPVSVKIRIFLLVKLAFSSLMTASPVASLTLDLKSRHSQTLLDQLITSTPSWPLQTSSLTSGRGDCAESYLNLLNLENSTKPEAPVTGQLEPAVTANEKVEDKGGSCRAVIPLTLRDSESADEK